MSMPSRPWARFTRVATATLFVAAGAVALVPSAANAAPEATVTAPGCSTTALPDSHYVSSTTDLSFAINSRGTRSSTVTVSDQGYLTLGGGNVNVFEVHLRTNPQAMPVTYGTTTFAGRPAFCATWTGVDSYYDPNRATFDAQALVVDRSDIQDGDFDLVYNYGRIGGNSDGARVGLTLSGPEGQDEFSFPGSGVSGALVDGSPTALASGSRESSVPGRYVFRFRGGALLTAAAPETTVATGPSGLTANASPTFTYTGSGSAEDTLAYECRLTAAGAAPGSFTTCPTSGADYADLAEGTWTFEVRSVGALGGADPTPASRTFTVDTTGPVTELGETPDALTNVNKPVFTWSSPDEDVDDAAYSCNLNRVPSVEPSPWYDCTSGEDITNLGDGDWRFEVRATDDLGNPGEPATYDFTIDTDAPVVELTEKPAARGNDTTPVVAWTSADDVDLFECNLDRTGGEGSPWEKCASGDELDLTDGDWTFQVRATDEAGNEGEPATYGFTVDTQKAAVGITGKPAARGNDATPSFTYVADPSTDLDRFVCVVVPVGAQSASPETCAKDGFTSEPLTDGDYRFVVVATDSAGNESDPATYDFTVDTTAPETTVTDGPSAIIGTGSATFGFASSESPATYECRISGDKPGAWEACQDGSKSYSGLTDGTWSFEVRATDAAGNTDITPASRQVKVNLALPTITAAISSPTPISEFGWYREAVTITYTCNGNGSALVGTCPAPREVPRAQQGKVVFRASVTTADGDTASVSTTLLIDKGKPKATIAGFSGSTSYSSMPKPRCKASDPRSGLDGCTISVRKVKRENGDVFVVVKATATDKAGNVRVVRKRAPFRAA